MVPRWHLNLSQCPRLIRAGHAVHGRASRIDRYSHLRDWSLHFYHYTGYVIADGHQLEIRPGGVSLVPPLLELEYHYLGESSHLWAHFSIDNHVSPTTANLESMSQFGVTAAAAQSGSAERTAETTAPAMQYLSPERFHELHQDFESAIAWSALQPRRAEARLWNLLWELTDEQVASTGRQDSRQSMYSEPVAEVIRQIELRLSQVLRVDRLAREADVSHNHLTRLFQQEVGSTVVAYIRKRRADRAKHLITGSTQSIKSIAVDVGVPNLQQFNKLIRRELGVSPSQLRRTT